MALSKMKAIVTRLESIEEMAGIDVLCSDKTGTLTENRLSRDGMRRSVTKGAPQVIIDLCRLDGEVASRVQERLSPAPGGVSGRSGSRQSP